MKKALITGITGQDGAYLTELLIEKGYEDFNLTLRTEKGKYFVKIFAKFRTPEDCERYVEIMETVIKAGVKHPKLLKSNQGFLHKIEKLRLCVMEHIDGDDYYSLKQLPTEEEVKGL